MRRQQPAPKKRNIFLRLLFPRRLPLSTIVAGVIALQLALFIALIVVEVRSDLKGLAQSKSTGLGSVAGGVVFDLLAGSQGAALATELSRLHAYIPSRQEFNTEEYGVVSESGFHNVHASPLSTFSIDVDTASYSNVRRFLSSGSLPPADAVRIEELINYFRYEYPEPQDDRPFALSTEMARCPWAPRNHLVRLALKSRPVEMDDAPPSNLVFLIDVSGSMQSPDKLPLLKKAFELLADQLRPEDRVAITVYAGAAGLVLPSTPGSDQAAIRAALEQLEAGGSTAGGAGIKLAYKAAREHFIADGNNRVILATDGDFNVGASSDGEMIELIERERESGIFLTVLGFGQGNLKDSKMEKIADHGNGAYAYIDSLAEAKRVLVEQVGATLLAVAKDVKLQVEFNPALVESYRLIGYENRLLAAEDFNDDAKDAGELGAGHTVTALYEIVPRGRKRSEPDVDEFEYQKTVPTRKGRKSGEALTVKVRYKQPDADQSRLFSQALRFSDHSLSTASDDFRLAAAVAEFGMLLRNSPHKGDSSYEQVYTLAANSAVEDEARLEFLNLTRKAQNLSN